MDKNCIRKFAVQARRDLIEQITNQANLLGIDKDGAAEELSSSTSEIKFYKDEHSAGITGQQIQWRQNLVHRLEERSKSTDWETAFTDTIEEVSYTWFNRIIALRFMEVNDYLPSRIRVLSSEEGRNEPDIVFYAEDHELQSELNIVENSDLELIRRAKASERGNDLDAMYQMLFFKQVDELNKILPGLFERTSDYMKLLFTPRYNTGVIKNLIDQIPETYFDVRQEGQVEIIGWLYQFYNEEPHDQVVNITGGAVKKSDIPAATQLFTTDWVVRYMVDNSLGKYYLERHPDSNINASLEFLLPNHLIPVVENQKLQDYTLIDNAMGSGHILIYAFDLFLKFYQEQGYTKRESAHLIVENNLYGLDIDKRAFQLAYFSLMMKVREYDRHAFQSNIKPNLFYFEDVNGISDEFYQRIEAINPSLTEQIKELVSIFSDAREIGSIIQIGHDCPINELIKLVQRIKINDELDLYKIDESKAKILKMFKIIRVLLQKYDIAVTNPPYLNKFNPQLKKYLKKYYKNYSRDLFSVFIYHNANMIKPDGYAAFMTPFVWMFIKSYEELRTEILDTKKIDSLIQLEYSAFEEATVPINTFVLKNTKNNTDTGIYLKLSDFKGGMEIQKDKVLEAIDDPNCKYLYRSNQANFQKIPGSPIAYWASDNLIHDFEVGTKMEDLVDARQGLATTDNKKFLRQWFEVKIDKIKFDSKTKLQAKESKYKWFPYNKGGAYRKWYGNYDYIVDYYDDGKEIKETVLNKYPYLKTPDFVVKNTDYYFREAITWSDINSGHFALRFRKSGSIHDVKGMSAFSDSTFILFEILGVVNSKLGDYIFNLLNPTISLQVGNFTNFPVLIDKSKRIDSAKVVQKNINLCQTDWDSFEISWDFQHHPFLNHIAEHKQNWSLEEAYHQWQQEALDRFNQLKSNEEELNKIFIDLYGLQEELTPEEDDKDVSVRKADQLRDVKSFLSYFIGCVFGRYSLDVEGLAYAGGEWDSAKYHSFTPNTDNILVLTDADYFGDNRDIIYRLKEFLKTIFGDDNLYKNLDFIASTLEPKKFDKGVEATDIIRQYFLNDFFKKDHLKIYQKRPIYWELNSGRAQAFKALIYLHRYNPDTMAMVRSSYLHELQQAYENTLKMRQEQLKMETDKKQIKLFNKGISKLKKQIAEIIKYDQELQHVASQRIELDLDDGVLVNHKKVQAETKILTPIK
ncbi:MAG: BREX-1 system adenine-specific DNA-methyltransferase PglX [Lactobacillus sp.]|nr:BREX-1 system adenine-specific DNA-methyltransferase PglX [Lactobacillus sp.]